MEAPGDAGHGNYSGSPPCCLRKRGTGFFPPSSALNRATAPYPAFSDVFLCAEDGRTGHKGALTSFAAC